MEGDIHPEDEGASVETVYGDIQNAITPENVASVEVIPAGDPAASTAATKSMTENIIKDHFCLEQNEDAKANKNAEAKSGYALDDMASTVKHACDEENVSISERGENLGNTSLIDTEKEVASVEAVDGDIPNITTTYNVAPVALIPDGDPAASTAAASKYLPDNAIKDNLCLEQREGRSNLMTAKAISGKTEELQGGDDHSTKFHEDAGSPRICLTKESAQPGEIDAEALPSGRQEDWTAHQDPSESSTIPHCQVWIVTGAVFVAVLAMISVTWLSPVMEMEKQTLDPVQRLNEEIGKMEQFFQQQRKELWRRSRIHLQRHLRQVQPPEPVSLILVGGETAERTLECLATRLADSFSMALNGSVLQVYGTRLANMDHAQVKLDLDNQLRRAFEGNQPAAVIHRLEELPPSSTLIFYRYCDHENAAYKHPLLTFTVLLPLDNIGPELSISKVEELVHSHIHQKFLHSDLPASFDRMDVDKLSGLWSRISHLILPVNIEERIERKGCKGRRD